MDKARYIVAVLVLIGLPPGLLLWFFIHPFASFWRKLGPGWTYGIVGTPMVAGMFALFLARDRLLATDFGTSYPLIALATLFLMAGIVIAVKRKRQLTFGILAGMPELSEEKYPGKLLTTGLYAKIRHPRYVEILLWTAGYALFANYLGPYILLFLLLPLLYLIVLIEEKELRRRFGSAYDDYSREVPRFVPRLFGPS